ncbi:glycine N-acyltransferase-like protein 3 [Sphaeramia orbicularis]|uniref:Glycine N-acyltransferase-like protein n=1 Tax=Sphaeramia orbicularis TaxID=375764 RepID=A0A673BNS6_9TELE|nr:glycine N-acyltransferase-like protein 3 [Sphaeramia orbicularis]
MELNEEQLKDAETKLKTYLPRSLTAYGTLVLMNRAKPDPMKVFVDTWPDFHVVVCRPEREQKGDSFKDIIVFATDETILKETIRNPCVIDWSAYLCVGVELQHSETFRAVASEKNICSSQLAFCHMMILNDVSGLPTTDSSVVSLSSLDESHIGLMNQTWKFGNDDAVPMIRNMIKNFPSCCVLDADGKPVSWVLTYASCAIGMLYTLPEHRGKGYAKVLISTMANRLHAQGLPVYCFIEKENTVSYNLFKSLGFTEDPSYKGTWFHFNYEK